MEDPSSVAVWYRDLKKHADSYKIYQYRKDFNRFIMAWIQTDPYSPPPREAEEIYRRAVGSQMSRVALTPMEPQEELDITVDDSSFIFSDGDREIVRVPFKPYQIDELRKKYRGNPDFKEYFFAQALLNHALETIGVDTFHLSIPREIQKELVEVGYLYEGFADPLTAGMVMYSKKATFGSLVQIEEFGSTGNFFNTEITVPAVVNPPFSEDILYEGAKKCVSSKMPILFVGPEWPDADYYELLSKSTKYHRQVNVPYYNVGNNTMIHNVKSHYWILGDGMVRDTDEIIDMWCEMLDMLKAPKEREVKSSRGRGRGSRGRGSRGRGSRGRGYGERR